MVVLRSLGVGLFAVFGFNREQQMIAALASLIVASAAVSVAAWTLLWRERRASRSSVEERKPAGDDGP
jgi:hypothetical protein